MSSAEYESFEMSTLHTCCNLPPHPARSQKIAEEELQCKAMAEVALAELEEVLPVLEEAVRVGTKRGNTAYWFELTS